MLLYRLLFITYLIAFSPLAFGGASITVTPSATEMSPNEELRLQFKVSVDQMSADIGAPTFSAPDFDQPTNTYSSGTNIESSMTSEVINGQRVQRTTVERSQTTMAILHPKKNGRLVISGIHALVNGQAVTASDIIINVHTGPSRGGTNPSHAKRSSNEQKNFYLKTEPSKHKAYKGEQIILSYTLYTRVNILGMETERFPTIPGFLKEDMDIPLMHMPLGFSPTVVNGQEYHKALLAQYAIYPVKEGTLTIDPLVAKFSYRIQTKPGLNQNDMDDVFGIFNRFFQAAQTTTELKSSDPVNIEVLPLPEKNKPQSFSGLVGDFDIAAVADKTSLKMGEPLNVKVKVEGKGHAGSLERLNVAWPKDFDLYEDKAETHFMKTGSSERIFDFVLVPKTKGSFEIPAIEVSMFNPETANYQIKKSQPIHIEVLEGTVGNVYVAKTNTSKPSPKDIQYWAESIPETNQRFGKVPKFLVMISFLLMMLSFWSVVRSKEMGATQARLKQNKLFLEKVHALPQSKKSAVEILGEVENSLRHVLEFKYGIFLGSLTRAELRRSLKEHGVSEDQASSIERLLEQCENLRFSPGGGNRESAKALAHQLVQLVEKISLVKH